MWVYDARVEWTDMEKWKEGEREEAMCCCFSNSTFKFHPLALRRVLPCSAAIDEPAIFLLRLLQQHGIIHSDGRPSTSGDADASPATTPPSSGGGGPASCEDVGPREAAMRALEKEIEQQKAAAVQHLTVGRKYADNIKATTEAAYHPDLDPDDPFVEAQV
jgi:hypothetical protein